MVLEGAAHWYAKENMEQTVHHTHDVQIQHRDGLRILMCMKCGKFATTRPKDLLRECKAPSKRGKQNLSRWNKGKHPHSDKRSEQRRRKAKNAVGDENSCGLFIVD